ncbi:hypothetical protein F4778DRAFT_791786 [Xylariomycetidae sp. FL2044]|nr:hypothetical protein F4778DRAFT_791786 [Xylariomycetidae sp. FL2044]
MRSRQLVPSAPPLPYHVTRPAQSRIHVRRTEPQHRRAHSSTEATAMFPGGDLWGLRSMVNSNEPVISVTTTRYMNNIGGPTSSTWEVKPANHIEIWALAAGTVYLILLLALLLFKNIAGGYRVHTRETPRPYRKSSSPILSLEAAPVEVEERGPAAFTSLSTSADDLMQTARRKSFDVATGFRREMGELRRMVRPARRVDEEAGLNLGLGSDAATTSATTSASASAPAPAATMDLAAIDGARDDRDDTGPFLS